MTTILRVNQPREILALVPYQLGFVPHSSAVLVSLRGPRRRVGLIARADLSDLAGPRGLELAEDLVRCVLRDEGHAVILVVYADGARDEVRDTVERSARAVGVAAHGLVEVDGVWLVTADTFHVCEWDPGREQVCDWDVPGHGLVELQDTEVGATMVMQGLTVAPSREEIAVLPAPAGARLRASCAAGARSWREREADVARWRESSLARWHEAVEQALVDPGSAARRWGDEASAAETGRLAVGLRDAAVRDGVLAEIVLRAVSGRTTSVEQLRAAGRTSTDGRQAGVPEAMAIVLEPSAGRSPDPDALRALVTLVEVVAGHGTRRVVGEGLALLAVLAWWEGSGARARLLTTAALRRAPDHRLALLVERVLDAAVPPGWAVRGSVLTRE